MEITVNVHVSGLDGLTEAIKTLAGRNNVAAATRGGHAMANSERSAQTSADATATSVQPNIPAPAPAAPNPTVMTGQKDSATQAVTPGEPQPTAPVTHNAPAYTLDELATAAAPLMDAGKLDQLQDLIARFGVPSLMDLPQEQYGAFATALRELGANI